MILLLLYTCTQLTHPSNWADEMDAIQSPQDDGFLTLPGQDSRSHSDRSKSRSPSPSPSTALTDTQIAKHHQHQPQQQQQEQAREAGQIECSVAMESAQTRERRREREISRSISPRYSTPLVTSSGCYILCGRYVYMLVQLFIATSTFETLKLFSYYIP